MTGYMYNPSKKVTELLSEYLEFDREKLQLGIWSGNLSLSDVQIRKDALYEILNRRAIRGAVQNAEGIDGLAPELRLRLVSGTIGHLSMKIPWKRLVWGPGDVKAELRNVTIVLSLEHREDVEAHTRTEKPSIYPLETNENGDVVIENHEEKLLSRERKQKRLREAERRHLQGRSLAPWMAIQNQKDQKEQATRDVSDRAALTQTQGSLQKWLQGATNDFFWRFCSGLEMILENIKVVIVQDDVEVGIIIPKSIVSAKDSQETDGQAKKEELEDSAQGSGGDASLVSGLDVHYESAYDDGEHIDKTLKNLGVCVYAREAVIPSQLEENEHLVPINVSNSEYIIRPADFCMDFGFFFPFPPEKRKKLQQKKASVSADTSTNTDGSMEDSTLGSSKRRRGKREKATGTLGTDATISTLGTPPPSIAPIRFVSSLRASSSGSVMTSDPGSMIRSAQQASGRKQSRRGSIAVPMPTTTVSRLQTVARSESVSFLPLVQPENIPVFGEGTTDSQNLTSRLEGRLSIADLKVVCSTRHYELFRSFFVTSSQIRNGRPKRTISSVLEDGIDQRRSLVVTARPDFLSIAKSHPELSELFDGRKEATEVGLESKKLRLELAGANSERSEVVRMWWRYVMTAIVHEVRQRRHQRRQFQKQFLSFSWELVSFRRREYVNLYIREKLNSQASESTLGLEKLLTIEDTLNIEQILLYRSIARALHVRGDSEMPGSILVFRAKTTADAIDRNSSSPGKSFDKLIPRSSIRCDDPHAETSPSDGLLWTATRLCEIAEQRGDQGEDEDLVPFGNFQLWKSHCQQNRRGFALDEMSTDGDKTVKTMRTMKSRVSRTTSFSRRKVPPEGSGGPRMQFSFALRVDSVEFTFVEEQNLVHRLDVRSESDESSLASIPAAASDVSGLTDDQGSFADGISVTEGDGVDSPIMASTDFLLFGLPENVIMKIVLKPILFSHSSSGNGASRVDLSVGRLNITGKDDVEMVSVGESRETAPVKEVNFGRRHSYHNIERRSSFRPVDAVTTSVVFDYTGTVLQCDVPLTKVTLDLETCLSLLKIVSSMSRPLPSTLLQYSPREEVREYILRENIGAELSSLSCSVRFHGCDICLPVRPTSGSHSSLSDEEGIIAVEQRPLAELSFRADMFEVYCGLPVEQLRRLSNVVRDDPRASLRPGSEASCTSTRLLKMLDVSKLSRPSLLSHTWVASATGLDLLLSKPHTRTKSNDSSYVSLLESPIDIEAALTKNEDSVFDLDNARQEVSVEVSPVHCLVSEYRVVHLARILQGLQPLLPLLVSREPPGSHDPGFLPPRLEVLSTYIQYVLDLNVGKMRLSLIADEDSDVPMSVLTPEDQFKDALDAFVGVVSCFDLSYPNEEALSSAMQVCIDRLTGLGFSLDTGWKATNTVLLNFLQAMSLVDQEYLSTKQVIDEAAQQAIRDTTLTFGSQIMELYETEKPLGNQIVMDLPNGATFSAVGLFYDSQYTFAIPSIFVTDSAGIHIFRATPPETSRGEDEMDEASPVSPKEEASAMEFGICVRFFAKDSGFTFGGGGLPLSAIGTDGRLGREEMREEERLLDFEFGDLDVLFSNDVLDGALDAALSALSKILEDGPSPKPNPSEGVTLRFFNSTRSLLTMASASVLFVADDHVPFCRLTACDIVGRGQESISGSVIGSDSETMVLTSKSISVLNLTSEGELFPSTVEVLPDLSRVPVRVSYRSRTSTGLASVTVDITGVQIYFLRQFVSETLQYWKSEEYGIGRLRVKLRSSMLVNESMKSEPSHATYSMHIRDSSLLIPRSTTRADMIAIEVDQASISLRKTDKSFYVRSDEAVYSTGTKTEFHDAIDSLEESKLHQSSISRTDVLLHGVRLFVAQSISIYTRDLPSFRYFYQVDGRAGPNKPVYRPNKYADEGLDRNEADEIDRFCWNEVTGNPFALQVIVDHVPQLRLLVADPSETEGNDISLEMKLSEFCLFLHLWFSNMKELPVLFPYPIQDVEEASRWVDFDFPELGTPECKDLLREPAGLVSECAFLFRSFTLTCKPEHATVGEPFSMSFGGANVHVLNDELDITRVSFSSNFAQLVDCSKHYSEVLRVGKSLDSGYAAADLGFGLELQRGNLGDPLVEAFQFTVFLSPKWSLYHMGLQTPNIILHDFSTVFSLLSFFKAFFVDKQYGNPLFDAQERADNMKAELMLSPQTAADTGGSSEFCLWLTDATLDVPCEFEIDSSPFLRLTDRGLRYRYQGHGDLSSQECVTSNLSMAYHDTMPKTPTNELIVDGTPLVSGLDFGLHLDFNYTTNHQQVSVVTPYAEENGCGHASSRISVNPVVLSPPTICVPEDKPARYLGPSVAELTIVLEVLPIAWTTLSRLFSTIPEEDSGVDEKSRLSSQDPNPEETTFSFTADLRALRVFALDPVLGPHLPVAVASLAKVCITASKFAMTDDCAFDGSGAPLGDLQIHLDSHLWADYFKMDTRCWEPLLEAYCFSVLYEKSKFRGVGVSVSSDTSFHLNISSALLLIVDQVADTFMEAFNATFSDSEVPRKRRGDCASRRPNETFRYEDAESTIVHEVPCLLGENDRVAFSLRNMTGQQVRIFRPNDVRSTAYSNITAVAYLENSGSTELVFSPSMSLVTNLSVIQVPYPGLPNSEDASFQELSTHAVDVQLPGFEWLRGITADVFGRGFLGLIPRSALVSNKIRQDWRLDNVLKMLAEVGLDKGGRQLTLRSIFTIANKTSHRVIVNLHPDPSFHPSQPKHCLATRNEIKPGESCEVPILLMEAALRQNGSHVGSAWFRPSDDEEGVSYLEEFLRSQGALLPKASVSFTSRALQLAELVGETSWMFEAGSHRDVSPEQAFTGVQRSCPVSSGNNRLAPFCYAIEVARSPIVAAVGQDKHASQQTHGPVNYTLSIHPPIVVINLLPERGRFELMHATRRTVLWFCDLEPGQEVAVHSVGLDAPLVLLVNLGFCRTPVGEGALVHQGIDPPSGMRENLSGLKSIGKAGKAVTKQLGKTLTALGESPDRRGLDKLQTLNLTQPIAHDSPSKPNKVESHETGDLGLKNGYPGKNGVDGKTYRVSTSQYYANDVASETCVVDGIGQRLELKIENIRGGGGQRRISLYCPFWIVNTTEHALRYRQDKTKHFVSGTIVNPDNDGSVPLSGGRSRSKYESSVTGPEEYQMKEGTIFSGAPGALCPKPGEEELDTDDMISLLDANMPIESMAKLAFMFNFHDGVLQIGQQKLSVQVGDGTTTGRYASDWSRGFSLDSVGYSQVVSMHCKDGRNLELLVTVSVAPGPLAGYTKVVRFLPRYVALNLLPYSIRLWQDSSVFRLPSDPDSGETSGRDRWHFAQKGESHRTSQYDALWGKEAVVDDKIAGGTTANKSALYIASLKHEALLPFSLPDSRNDRQLRVGIGGLYELTASFEADIPGEHTLRVNPATDLRLLKHVSTRASPQYTVTISPRDPFLGELGLWFETDWGSDRSLIVKNVKKNSFAYTQTDVHVGDELLGIDDVSVPQILFSEAMALLRRRLVEIKKYHANQSSRPKNALRRSSLALTGGWARQSTSSRAETEECAPLVLTFRTVEERLRRIRLKAARNKRRSRGTRSVSQSNLSIAPEHQDGRFIKVDMKTLHGSNFLIFRESESVPYAVHNRTINSTIFYRQKGCNAHQWHSLRPGQSAVYTWDEPLRPRRLSVRVASEAAFYFSRELLDDSENFEDDSEVDSHTTGDEKGHRTAPRVRDDEEAVFSPSMTVRLEEIGWKDFLRTAQTNGSEKRVLELEVQVISSTRVLVVQELSDEGDIEQMGRYMKTLRSLLEEERLRSNELKSLRQNLLREVQNFDSSVQTPGTYDPISSIVHDAKGIMADVVQEDCICSRHQLRVEVLEAAGLNSGYYLGGTNNPYAVVYLRSGYSRSIFRRRNARKTYYVKKSSNPVWDSQAFVFDVPHEASSITRGHSLCVSIKNFKSLGYHSRLGKCRVDLHSLRNQKPLVGWFPLSGRSGRGELDSPLEGRGSIKLSVQWVFSIPALMDYFILLSENRISKLRESMDGMEDQLKKKEEVENAKEALGVKTQKLNELLTGSKAKQNKQTNRFLAMARVKKSGNPGPSNPLKIPTGIRLTTPIGITKMPRRAPSRTSLGGSRELRSLPDVSKYGVDLIQNKRAALDALASERRRIQGGSQFFGRESFVLQPAPAGHVTITAFRSWVAAQTILNDPDLRHWVHESEIRVQLKQDRPMKEHEAAVTGVNAKLALPSCVPKALLNEGKAFSQLFEKSRNVFDTHAKHSLATVTSPGGWLTIRPLTALNLEDNYTGMYVKIRYGSETFTSLVADSRVYPTWYRLPNQGQYVNSIPDDESPNDLHMLVAPQKTSGVVKVSVVGESGHKNLSTKSELGIVNLPLSAVISACTHSSNKAKQELSDNAVPAYVRWFPLLRPRDAVPLAGDCGASLLPPETEKVSDHLFKEYFAPCIQLALIWRPIEQKGPHNEDKKDGDSRALVQESEAQGVDSYFNASIGRVSAALIDSQRAVELLSCSVREIDFKYWVTKTRTHIGMAIGWLQLDNQLDNARESVIFAPAPSNQSADPVFHIIAVKDNIRSRDDVLSFQYIDVSVAEFDLTVEEIFMIEFFGFVNTVLAKRSSHPVATLAEKDQESTTWTQLRSSEDRSLFDDLFKPLKETADGRVYIEHLFLGVVKFNISYLKGKKQNAAWEPGDIVEGIRSLPQVAVQGGERLKNIFAFHHEKSDVFLLWSQQTSDEDHREGKDSGFGSLPALFTALLPNVSDAPIRLQGKVLNHIFESPQEVLQSIRKFYVNETLRQIYKIIGSLDFVGNPAMLVSSFFSGVRDLVVAPSTAFMRSPTDASQLGLGVAKGTISLVSHSTSGFFGFMSKVAAGAGQGLAVVSLDPEFRTWHRDKIVTEVTNMNREWKRRGVQNVSAMITRPLGDVAHGVISGVGGLVVAPLRGYRSHGRTGFIAGVGRGGIGVVIRPTVGVLDAVAHFSASVHDVAKSVNVLEKRYQPVITYRLPYSFGPMNILAAFNTDLTRADMVLKKYPMKKSHREAVPRDEKVVHMEVLPNMGTDTFVIVTCYRILLIKMSTENGTISSTLSWTIMLSGSSKVSSTVSEYGHNGVALTVTITKQEKGKSEEVAEAESATDKTEEAGLEDAAEDSEIPLSPLGKSAASLDHDRGLERGRKGELLEWYTVLAEYQNRLQLTKLHNAICCIVGDFGSVLHDPSLGHVGSADGYTSFGLFHFRPDEVSSTPIALQEADRIESLDSLRWVDKGVFSETVAIGDEEETSLPTWLELSFERAINMEKLELEEFAPGDSQVSILPTIVDCSSEEDSVDGQEVDDDPEEDPVDHHEKGLTKAKPLEVTQSLPNVGALDPSSGQNPREGLLRWKTPKDSSDNTTFFSPLESATETPRLDLDQGHQSGRTLVASNTSPPDEKNTAAPEHGAENEGSTEQGTVPQREVDRVPSSPGSRLVPSLATGASRDATRESAEARMDRMENLMERLLIFSAEQSIANRSNYDGTVTSINTEDVEVMRRELDSLRAKVEEQSHSGRGLEQLREEVANLRAQIRDQSTQGEIMSIPEEVAEEMDDVNGDTTVASDEVWDDAACELSASFSAA